ncbi:MAG TPA: AtpZ/AtpI family protein [Dermatophilaceae bacterium]|nr:AtpZ/AtpI family protein [Dermatophilaceae bacterium]
MTNATPPAPETPESARKAQEQAAKDALARVNQREADAAWRSIAYLLTGPAVYGGLGWLLDHWLGTSWIAVLGICGGMALSLYLIWFRYGTH